MIPFPTKQYTVIYADPPWEYDDQAFAGNRGACCKYDVMSVEDICSFPVATIAAKDSILFMWATMPKLREAFKVIESWGFEFKTTAFTWLKYTKHGEMFWGMGRWTRANPELCLLASRGQPKRISAAVHSVIDNSMHNILGEHIGRHSEKPNIARTRIVDLMGDVPRIELFARKRYHGWDTWGNEVNDYYEDSNALDFG